MKNVIIILALALAVQTQAAKDNSSYHDLRKIAFSETEEMAARWNSLMKMTSMKKNESVVDLRKALTSKVWYMRNAGLIALHSINPELAYEEAKKQLQDPALVVRSAAVDIMTKNTKKSAEVRKLLWQEFDAKKNKVKSQSLWIRPQIIQFLAENPLINERDQFLSLSEEKDPEVRASAEKALAKLQRN